MVPVEVTLAALGALGALGALACDSDAAAIDRGSVAATVMTPPALVFAAPPVAARLPAGAPVSRVGADDGDTIVAAGATLARVHGLALEVVDEPGDVFALAPRAAGTLVSAAEGLFHTRDGALFVSPASAALAGATALAVSTDAAGGEVVWAALPDGLHRLDAAAHTRLVIAAEAGTPDALAALSDRVALAYGEHLYTLDADDLELRAVDVALGAIHEALAAGDTLAVGGDGGLALGTADGGWRLYPIGAVHALAADGEAIIARLDDGLVRWSPSPSAGAGEAGDAPGTLSALAALPAATTAWVGVALDRDGHAWLGDGAELVRLATGHGLSFASDVAPILAARCASCHAEGEGAPRRDFTDYALVVALAEPIFTRIRTGLMPPPPSPGLTPAELELVSRWYAGERAP